MQNTDQDALRSLSEALDSIDEYYRARGIFQDRFGFGESIAIVVVDFAYGWTDESYAAGSKRLDAPVEATAQLLAAGRTHNIPIIYTTSPWRPQTADQPFKSAADATESFRAWDERAVQIDSRVAPEPQDYIIEKESASAFSGTHLIGYLTELRVDTLVITGCSTSACIRATATDAKSLRLRPIIVRECVGDRSAAAQIFTLHDIQARFADVCSLGEVVEHLESRPAADPRS